MIKVNLLPFRAARKKENIRRQVSIFLLSIVLLCAALYWWTGKMDTEIAQTRAKITQVKSQIKLFKEKADRVTEIQKNLKILNEKLAVVASLEKRRNEQQILLEETADRIVKERMWIESVTADGAQVVIKGIAFDNPTIADFMQHLEASPLFTSIDLKRSVSKVFEGDIALKAFELVCAKKAAVPEPEKKGKK